MCNRLCSTPPVTGPKPERPDVSEESTSGDFLARRRRSTRRVRPTALSSAYQMLLRPGEDDDEADGYDDNRGGGASRLHRSNRRSRRGVAVDSDAEFHPDSSASDDEEEDDGDGDEDYDVRIEHGARDAHSNSSATRANDKRSRVSLLF